MSVPLAVRLAELRGDLEQSYRNTVYCSSTITQHDGQLHAEYCGNRWCLVCNRIRTAKAINAYLPVVETWDDPHLVTLTVRNCSEGELEAVLKEMFSTFTSCKRSIKRTHKRKFKALRKLECTHNTVRDDYHPHFHSIVEGEAAALLLRDLWVKRFGERAVIQAQDVRRCDESSLREVFKYFTKLTTKGKDGKRRMVPAEKLDVIFKAMRGRRVWQPVGFSLPKEQESDVEGERLDVSASPACKRVTEAVLWQWEQDVADWVDAETGEVLSDYEPSEGLQEFVSGGKPSHNGNRYEASPPVNEGSSAPRWGRACLSLISHIGGDPPLLQKDNAFAAW
jgi:hypothetical protein